MSSRRINAMLWSGAFVLAALTVLLVAWAILSPVEPEALEQARKLLPQTNPTNASGLPALSDVQALLDKPLRKNLNSAAPTTSVANLSNNANQPPLTLVGTIGNSLAMLRMPDGKIELKAVGESIAGMTVVAISPNKVDVRHNGKVISLDKQRRG